MRTNGSARNAADDMLREAIMGRGGKLDCIVAEFIIGPAEGGTRWLLAMTIASRGSGCLPYSACPSMIGPNNCQFSPEKRIICTCSIG